MSEKTIEESVILVMVKNYRFTSLDTSVGIGTPLPEGKFWMDDGDIYSLDQLIERFEKDNVECLTAEDLKERLDKENYIKKSKVEEAIKKLLRDIPKHQIFLGSFMSDVYKGALNDLKKELGLEEIRDKK